MSVDYIRVWQVVQIGQIKETLLMIGDATAVCGNCKELGLNYATVATCPACGANFKYMASKNAASSQQGRFHVVKRLSEVRPDLIFVDLEDFKTVTGRNEAQSFFKD